MGGPYLSERAWGTVREDYSEHGTAWDYFPHDHARSRAYRWNEDGMAGICDDRQTFCFALALWNGKDPILKERMFGLGGDEGNHGEDAKEYWWYLDSTPTHSWMRWRYHYPQQAFPYERPGARRTRARGRDEPEYELVDTGIFDEDRYWAVTVDYAKAVADRHVHARHGRQPRPGAGHPARAAHAVVPQHLGVGPARLRRSAADPRVRRGPAGRPSTGVLGRLVLAGRRASRDRCSATTRPTPQRLWGWPAGRRTRRTASTTTWCTASRTVNPDRVGTKARAALRARRAGRGDAARSGCG